MPTLVIECDGRPEQRAEVKPLPFKIGKKAGPNHLVLDDLAVSREHCAILLKEGRYCLQDLKSRNGTYMQGGRIAGTMPLAEGASFHIGPFTLTFTAREPINEPAHKRPRRHEAPPPEKRGRRQSRATG